MNKCCFDCGYSLSCSTVCEKYRNQSIYGGKCVPENICNNNCSHFKDEGRVNKENHHEP